MEKNVKKDKVVHEVILEKVLVWEKLIKRIFVFIEEVFILKVCLIVDIDKEGSVKVKLVFKIATKVIVYVNFIILENWVLLKITKVFKIAKVLVDLEVKVSI